MRLFSVGYHTENTEIHIYVLADNFGEAEVKAKNKLGHDCSIDKIELIQEDIE